MSSIQSPFAGGQPGLPPALPDREPPDQTLLTIDDLIADLLEKHSQLAAMLDQAEDVDSFLKVFAVYSRSAAHLGRLYREKRLLPDDPVDALESALSQAVDEVAKELGIDLG